MEILSIENDTATVQLYSQDAKRLALACTALAGERIGARTGEIYGALGNAFEALAVALEAQDWVPDNRKGLATLAAIRKAMAADAEGGLSDWPPHLAELLGYREEDDARQEADDGD